MFDLYDLYDLYDLAHVAGWEPYILHGLAHVSWVGAVLYMLILRNLRQRQARNYIDDLYPIYIYIQRQIYHDLSVGGVGRLGALRHTQADASGECNAFRI